MGLCHFIMECLATGRVLLCDVNDWPPDPQLQLGEGPRSSPRVPGTGGLRKECLPGNGVLKRRVFREMGVLQRRVFHQGGQHNAKCNHWSVWKWCSTWSGPSRGALQFMWFLLVCGRKCVLVPNCVLFVLHVWIWKVV